jgi:hypothetical protein
MDNDKLTLEEALDTLQRERHARKESVLERARAALAAAREDIDRGVAVDENTVRELERSIAEFEKYTLERPGLPPE